MTIRQAYAWAGLLCGTLAIAWGIAAGLPGLRLPVWPCLTLAGLAWALASSGEPTRARLAGCALATLAGIIGLLRLAMLWLPTLVLRVI